MGWFRRGADEGAPQPQIPDLDDGCFTYKTKVMRDLRTFYLWTCPRCLTEIGSCNLAWPISDTTELRTAARAHIRNHHLESCGEESCISCPPPPVVVT